MAVPIRAERVEQKIRELAERTGETVTEAVEKAVDHRLATLPAQRKARVDQEGTREAARRDRRAPGGRSAQSRRNHGVDEDGLPR